MLAIIKRFYLLAIFSASYLASPCEAAKLHLIMVCDTEDESIGQMVVHDLDLTKRRVIEVAHDCTMPLDIHRFYGETFDSELVMQTLLDLQVEEDDCIFFYYSGHGFRSRLSYGSLPSLIFSDGMYALDTGRIVEMLEQKGARMVLALADSCNNYLPLATAPNMYATGPYQFFLEDKTGKLRRNNKVRRQENLKRLFKSFKGTVEIAAVVPYETAGCTMAGSYYSNIFWEKVIELSNAELELSWERLLDEVAEVVLERYQQLPMFNIYEPSAA